MMVVPVDNSGVCGRLMRFSQGCICLRFNCTRNFTRPFACPLLVERDSSSLGRPRHLTWRAVPPPRKGTRPTKSSLRFQQISPTQCDAFMAQPQDNAVTPRAQDYPQWYLDVIKRGELAENSAVRGCMVIKPHGYAIWEKMQRELDDRFKATGHVNAYFPLFIPLSYFTREERHAAGFAKAGAVVTHHRLKTENGEVVADPESRLEEPLVSRLTSVTIICAQ